MSNKIKFTIGIPAHNEEKSIGNLISSILKQKSRNYVLNEIIVACDNCTDNTISLVAKLKRSNKCIKILDMQKRMGKPGMLNLIFSIAKSDFIVCLDADVSFGSKSVLDYIAKCFQDKNPSLVGGNIQPNLPVNLIQKIGYARSVYWKNITEKINEGRTIHNSVGRIFAITRKMAKKINIPSGIRADDDFIYLSNKKLGGKFEYCKDAVALYRLPRTISDYQKQFGRFKSSEKIISKLFGQFADSEYQVPEKLKIMELIKMLIIAPIQLIFVISSQVILAIGLKDIQNEGSSSIWEPIRSTRKI